MNLTRKAKLQIHRIGRFTILVLIGHLIMHTSWYAFECAIEVCNVDPETVADLAGDSWAKLPLAILMVVALGSLEMRLNKVEDKLSKEAETAKENDND